MKDNFHPPSHKFLNTFIVNLHTKTLIGNPSSFCQGTRKTTDFLLFISQHFIDIFFLSFPFCFTHRFTDLSFIDSVGGKSLQKELELELPPVSSILYQQGSKGYH